MNKTIKSSFNKSLVAIGLSLTLSACGGSDTTPTVNVEGTLNSAPEVTSSSVTAIEADGSYSYTFAASDADADTLTLSAETLPEWLSFDAATGTLSGKPAASDVGEHSISLMVSDGTAEVTQTFTITVTATDPEPENNLPVITSTSVDVATAGSLYSYTLTATDADSEPLTMSASTLPAWLSFDVDTGVLSGTPAVSDVGTADITLSVTDGTDTTDQAFTITVSEVVVGNTPAEITSTAVLDATVDVAYSYTLTATDADSDDLTMSASTLPSWLTFDAGTGVLSGTPASGDVAASEITLTVNDGTDDTTQTFTLTVADEVVERVPAFVVYEDEANPLWAAWDCCGGSTPAIITDANADYGQVTQFTINGGTVVGFNARDAVGGVAYDTPAGTTLEFDLKVTKMPADDTTAWFVKVEDSAAGDSGDVNLNTSAEGLAPVLDTWMHYTFNVAALGRTDINLIMVYPAWGPGDGAEFSIDNVEFYFDAEVGERTPGDSGDGATTTTAMGVDFEGPQLTWSSFDTAKVQYVANPNTGGINTSTTAALFDIHQADGEWIGATTQGIDNFALDTSNCVVKLDVYKDTISETHIKFEKQHGDGWGSHGSIGVANTVVNQWETLTVDFCHMIGMPENDDIGGFTVFPDKTATRSQNTMNYVDNIMFTAQGNVPPPPPVDAPTTLVADPILAEGDVISLHTSGDVYTNITVNEWNPNWGQGGSISDDTVAGKTVKKVDLVNYQGIDFASTDITGKATLHMSVYADSTEAFNVFVITGAAELGITTGPLVAGAWNEIEVDLSATGSLSTAFQIKFDGGTGQTLWLDNVYFH